MKNFWICLLALSIFALALLPMSTLSQSTIGDRIFYPPEFSPLNTASSPLTTTSQSLETEASLTLASKFVKVQDAIPNRYIVVLNDDVVASDAELKDREAAINAIAESHAKDYDGKVGFVYETALKGYSIELKDEAAAIKISKDEQVLWVEEVGRIPLAQAEPEAFQTNPPWGLDAIDGSVPVPPVAVNGTTNGLYVYNATGAGSTAYVLDTGLRRTHQEFGVPPFVSRASIAADFIAGSPYLDVCIFPKPNASDNDCGGHGTHVAGTLGGTTYGVAKGVTILSVKVCTSTLLYGCPTDVINAGVNWVTNHHNANPSGPAVANMSISGPASLSIDTAVQNSINAGVTYTVAAGNFNNDARFYSPAGVAAALTIGSINPLASRVLSCNPGPGSNFGGRVDLFAPGYYVLSAWSGSDTQSVINCGTSMASAHVAGAVAMYLQGRTGTNRCAAYPIQGPASPLGGSISTCPDRVARFIASNANLNKLSNVNGVDSNGVPVSSTNRLLWTATLPTTRNPIDNQRFFTWQQYSDFLPYGPDNGGLEFWTNQMINNCHTGLNDNNACVRNIRALVSKEFFRAAFPSAFNDNAQFVQRCYERYLRRSVSANNPGFQFWLGVLNSYGRPASEAGKTALIDAFIGDPASNGEYRLRFGQMQP